MKASHLSMLTIAAVLLASYAVFATRLAAPRAPGRRSGRQAPVSAPQNVHLKQAGSGEDDPYPPGYDEPVPTQTDIPPSEAKYAGLTGQQVAATVVATLESGPTPMANPPTTYVDSVSVSPAEGERFQMGPEEIAWQSPEDLAIVMSGDFRLIGRGSQVTGQMTRRYPYVLVLLDTYSGHFRATRQSDDLQALLNLLHPPP